METDNACIAAARSAGSSFLRLQSWGLRPGLYAYVRFAD